MKASEKLEEGGVKYLSWINRVLRTYYTVQTFDIVRVMGPGNPFRDDVNEKDLGEHFLALIWVQNWLIR